MLQLLPESSQSMMTCSWARWWSQQHQPSLGQPASGVAEVAILWYRLGLRRDDPEATAGWVREMECWWNMCRQNLVMFWQLFKQRKWWENLVTMSTREVWPCHTNKSFGLQWHKCSRITQESMIDDGGEMSNLKLPVLLSIMIGNYLSNFFWLTPIYPSKPSSGVNSCRKIFLTILCLPKCGRFPSSMSPFHSTRLLSWPDLLSGDEGFLTSPKSLQHFSTMNLGVISIPELIHPQLLCGHCLLLLGFTSLEVTLSPLNTLCHHWYSISK